MIRIFTAFVLSLFIVTISLGQVHVKFNKAKMNINGTSTLHDWTSDVTKVDLSADLVMIDGELIDITNLVMKIRVEDIKSEKGSMMDKNTFKALKYEKFPYIFGSMQRTTSLVKNKNVYQIAGTCQVSIGGSAVKVPLKIEGVVDAEGDIVFSGQEKIKMTDFNIEPPVVLMGTLKTGNEVVIKYSFVIPCVDDICFDQ
jgi:hypothetical protein